MAKVQHSTPVIHLCHRIFGMTAISFVVGGFLLSENFSFLSDLFTRQHNDVVDVNQIRCRSRRQDESAAVHWLRLNHPLRISLTNCTSEPDALIYT